ncbi:5'-AMP-activated protein kinase beta subunit, interation domain-containing protein [Mycena maculata]|uniref:5'-AMP-activated protein kinase beta subunit, interation domain-containing protein n=1 Tax=Mycena maculata TaxID=230809 RepID=A0AAD7HUQ8_9AGAR|nr:5'-AMP-activated protein kinase beta subunit, interation domain-containing protein [Mycena maculata]
MGNSPSSQGAPLDPRSTPRKPRPPTSPRPAASPSAATPALQTLADLVAEPTPPPTHTSGSDASSTLRPNRKSIDLPGLNTFAPAAPSPGSSRVSSSRIVERGRTWLHREGRYANGSGSGRGRGATPPRSAAIAIPGRRGGEGEEREVETGYGMYVRDGIAKRKAEARGPGERERGRSPTRSRSRPAPAPAHHHPQALNYANGLRAPSASRSHSHSNSQSRSSRSPSRETRGSDGRRGRSYERHRDADLELQERERNRERYEQLYGAASHAPQPTPAFTREVVFSTIPLTIGPMAVIGVGEGDGEYAYADEEEEDVGGGMGAVVDEIVGAPPPPPDEPPLTAVPITWRAPAGEVFLIRAGDEDWMGRRPMERVSGSPTAPFTTTIHLPPGTHHFRFIVDGATVVAPPTEIPNAVDDQGFIANYVAVPGPVATTTPSTASVPPTSASAAAAATYAAGNKTSPGTSATVSPGGRPQKRRRPSVPVHPDGSFWARSSAGGSHEDVRLAERVIGAAGGARGPWTNEIPEALVRAAAEEEAWLDAQAQYQQHPPPQGGRDGSRGRHIVLNGFVPEPVVPPAPRLPRHLERLILNRPSPGVVIPRAGTGAGSGGASGSSMNAVGASPALRVTTASGTDVSVPAMMSFTSAGNSGTTTPGAERTNATHPQFGGGGLPSPAPSKGGPPSPSGGMLLIADDPSVLQTPSHAVLYHLCTSSIRDKMIAVGASTRYRQKYLTTVYYKPAVPVGLEE